MELKLSNDKFTLQLETVLENKSGHLYTITFTDVSVNNIIASGSWDGTLRLYSEDKEQEALFFFKEPIEGLRFSPNGKFLAVGIENQLHIYDMNTKKSFRVLPKEPAMRGAVFSWSDDSSKLAIIFYDNSIRIFDVLNQKELGLITDVPSLGGNIITWKKDILAVGLNNSQIALYNLNSAVFQMVGSLEGHEDIVNAVAFSNVEDEMILYSVSSDGTLRSWDLAKNSKSKIIYSHSGALLYLSIKQTFSGQYLIACSEMDNIVFIEEQLQETISLQESSYCNASINAKADKFVRGINDHDLGIFSINDKKLISTLKGKNDQINSVKLLNNNEIIYASNDKTIHVINFDTKKESIFKGHTESISSLSVTKDKKKVVSASYDDSIRLWDLQSKKELRVITQKAELPSAVLFNEDDTSIFCASGGDFTVRGYRLDGTNIFSQSIHEEYVNYLLPYKAGFFSIGDDKKVVFWKNNKGRVLARGDSEITAIAVSSNSELLAFGTAKGLLTILEIKSSQKKGELKFSKPITCCSFSPDDKFIAIGTYTHLFVHEFETKEKSLVCTLYEPVKQVFWDLLPKDSIEDPISRLLVVSVAREVQMGKLFLTADLEKVVSKIDKLKVFTETQVTHGKEVIEQPETPEMPPEPVIDEPLQPEIETTTQTVEPEPVPEIEQINLLEKFQEEVESMVSSEKENEIISDFSTNLSKNMSSLELGSLVYKEYLETLKHLDKIQELIQVNSDESHEGFKIIYNRIKRLKPVINEALEEIDFILD